MPSSFRPLLLALAVPTALPVLAQTTPVTPRTMIVMDGSGSMWGQIDGVPKLEIARNVVADVLAGMEPSATLGLIAYGHRRRGDCSDIEVMVEPAPGSASAIAERVNTMRFQGRTPLTEAVRRAAEVLRSSEDPATVVLVTDGIETCEADPCALGRELEASGVNFTAHVVGFGLSAEEGAQVACLAEETGGRYFQADDAAALTEALTQTLAAPAPEPTPEPRPEPLPVEPAVQPGPWYQGPGFTNGLQLQPTGRSRETGAPMPAEISFPAEGTAEMCQTACASDALCTAWQYEPPGSLFVAEARCHLYGADAELDYSFDAGFAAGTNPEVPQLTRPFERPLPDASLSAPLSAPALSTLTVEVGGPLNPLDYLDIIEEGGNRLNAVPSYAYLRDGVPVRIAVPATPGRYTLRYVEEVEGQPPRILASQPLEVTELTYALMAPDSAQGGGMLSVDWVGPAGERDYIDIIEAGAERTNAAASDAYVNEGNPLPLILPLAPGLYDIRYIVEGSEGRVVALTRPLTVTAPQATLSAPERVGPGTEFAIDFTGPANGRSWIDLSPVGNAEFSGELTYDYLAPGSSRVMLWAPAENGDYELRFVAEDMRGNRQILARRAITVVPGIVPPPASAAPAAPGK
ncbi:VWA domain-containing protein [Pararhodobacter aggregans]|uniref:VWA domain-containing protein n=1 Tax=Pararhodobacter aggregans TaxID=404875 RepID=A0A2T7UMI5_9RHOB|nr:VWA domain-containing protein [Pararhodobacter aggregans]PTW99124.1 Ca-activated chloride channel family protein [Pararhodobacter aggregans]PVE45848.1 VWA domain-containing protein [Pararhodobacter aggregans]